MLLTRFGLNNFIKIPSSGEGKLFTGSGAKRLPL